MDDDIGDTGMGPVRQTLSQLRLRELLVEVQDRVEQIVDGRDRLDGLVEAMLVVTSGLELIDEIGRRVHGQTRTFGPAVVARGIEGAGEGPVVTQRASSCPAPDRT
jgi:hypothetical protein